MTDWCRVLGCEDEASRDIKIVPLCYTHGFQVAKAYRRRILAEENAPARRRGLARRGEPIVKERPSQRPSVVYYALIGDYIKIGYSTRLHRRLATLRVDRLLAIEPGGPALEKQRHGEFRAERIDLRRENFRPSERLDAHMAELLEEHGLPLWATLPRTTAITTTRLEETDV